MTEAKSSRTLRILALVHRVPYPPNKGEKIRAYHELRYLADRGHAIDLGTFADTVEDRQWHEELSRFLRDVAVVSKNRRFSRARSVLAVPRGLPLSVEYFRSIRLSRTVRNWLERRSYDVAFCYSSPMAEYVRTKALAGKRIARVMDFVDVDSDKWRQYAERTDEPMRSVYRFEAGRLAEYEQAIAREFDASTFVSAAEASTFLRSAVGARNVLGIPNGVDADYFGDTKREPTTPSRLVFVGQMDYFANVDAVKYFADDVFPKIRERAPDVRFQIVGRAPTSDVKKLGDRPGVEVTGEVKDVRDYLGQATIMVAPLRIARGIQNKVLEGMAARVPVVAAPAAFEGIEGQDGKHALVAGDARSYADAVLDLLGNPEKANALAAEARRLIETSYAWQPAMRRLEDLMFSLVQA